jgi:hypothetical protein
MQRPETTIRCRHGAGVHYICVNDVFIVFGVAI